MVGIYGFPLCILLRNSALSIAKFITIWSQRPTPYVIMATTISIFVSILALDSIDHRQIFNRSPRSFQVTLTQNAPNCWVIHVLDKSKSFCRLTGVHICLPAIRTICNNSHALNIFIVKVVKRFQKRRGEIRSKSSKCGMNLTARASKGASRDLEAFLFSLWELLRATKSICTLITTDSELHL